MIAPTSELPIGRPEQGFVHVDAVLPAHCEQRHTGDGVGGNDEVSSPRVEELTAAGWDKGQGRDIGASSLTLRSQNMQFASYPSLRNAVVYVTGGASGIGMAMVKAFAGQGAHVGFVDIAADEGRTLAKELGEAGAKIYFEACDLREIEGLKTAFAALKRALGPASVLINNAARDDRHGWQDVTPDYYDERMSTNLRHIFFAIQTA